MYRLFIILLSSLLSISYVACGDKDHDHDHDHEGHHHEEGDHDHEEDEGHHHEGALIIEGKEAEKLGISIDTVKESPFSEIIKVSGVIEPSPSDIMTVSAKRSGIFRLSPGVSPGTSILQGASIGTISPEGVQGGDANAAVLANIAAAKREFERLEPLYKDGLVTATAYNEAKRAYEESKALGAGINSGGPSTAVSPVSGTLTELFVNSGQYVETGEPIAIVAKSTRMTLRADVPQRYVNSIATITTANFRPDYSEEIFALEELDGRRMSEGSAPQANNGFIPLYFTFTGNGKTLPGTFTEIFLVGKDRERVLNVPCEAVLEMQGNKYVYVVEDGHAYEKRFVKTGATDGKRIVIKEGLDGGEQIVSKGASIVRMAEVSAVAPPSHNHNH